MEITSEKLRLLRTQFGDAFYLLDPEQFNINFNELKTAFTAIYPKFNIAYSYKTNYIPKFCKIVDRLGGYAEVVSDMEMDIALRIGVSPDKIIWNGPYKKLAKVREFLLLGGTINIDSIYELDVIKRIAEEYPDKRLNVGVRCNFDVNDGVISRFGFDIKSEEFRQAITLVTSVSNIYLKGMQCHFATRALPTWKSRALGMLKLINELKLHPEHIDLGGGLFGKMDDSLKAQFDLYIPTYNEYADAVASLFAEHFKDVPYDKKPLLFIEPGSAVVSDCMKFASKVVNIKIVRGKAIATLLGSIYNINPTLNKKNPPISVFHMNGESAIYHDLDFGGFTCIESDYLYRHYNGELAVDDMVVFGNVGSYSIVLKPPFILPNFPIIDISGKEVEVIKRGEYFDDLFHTYCF